MPDAPSTPSGGPEDIVFAAVERYIELREAQAGVEMDSFLAGYPRELRAGIEEQCRAYLSLDDVLGAEPPAGKTEAEGSERRIGSDFLIEEEIGRGGMGVVYRARQESLGRVVALKVMSSGLAMSRRHVERFRQEAASAARVQHPGIVPIYASGEIDGTLYTAMEFIAGHDLAERIATMREEEESGRKRRYLGIGGVDHYRAEVAECVAQVADALAAAHEAGVIHRDVKPSNIIIGLDGRIRVVDFGLAKALDTASVSVSGELTGTPHYMSPEQTLAKRAPVDHRSDIFSLGVILYELLTLRRPFTGDDLQNIFYSICFQDPPSIARVDSSVPRDLVTICEKALAKDPARRFQSASDMADDLRRFLRFKPIRARPAGITTKLAKWVRRHRMVTTAAASVLLAVVAGSSWALVQAEAKERELTEHLRLAAEAEEAGELGLAIRHMTRASTLAPADRELQFRLGRLQSEWRRAAADVSRLLAESTSASHEDPSLALQLALESHRRVRGVDADAQRRIASALLPILDRHEPVVELPLTDWPMAHEARFTPDAAHILVAGALGTVELYAVDALLRGEDRAPRSFEGHAGQVWKARVSADGRIVASSGDDCSVRVWALEDARPLAVFTGLGAPPRDLAIAPDASALACVDRQGELRVWSLPDNAERARVRDPQGPCRWVSFLPGRELLVTSHVGAARRICVRSLDGKIVHERSFGAMSSPAAPLVDPAGSWYACATPEGFARFSSETYERVALYATGSPVRRSAYDPRGERVALACEDRTISIWSLDASQRVKTLAGAAARIDALAFRTRGDRLLASATDRTLYDWSLANPSDMRRLVSPNKIGELSIDNANDRFVSCGHAGLPRMWLPRRQAAVHHLPAHGRSIIEAVAHADGSRYVTGGKDNRLRVFETSTGRLLAQHRFGTDVLFSAVGDALYAGGTHTEFAIWRFGERKPRLRQKADTRGVDLSRDDAFFAYGDAVGRVRVLSTKDGRELARLARPTMIRRVAFSPDASKLAVSEYDAVVRIFDWRRGEELLRLGQDASLPMGLRWSPDGSALAITRENGRARIWDLATGTLRCDLVGHTAECHVLDFAPGGARVVTSSFDGSVRLWRVEDGLELVRHTLHGERPSRAYFVGEDRVWSADMGGNCMTWPANPIAFARAQRLPQIPLLARQRYGVMRDVDERAKRLVDELYENFVLTRDVQRALADIPRLAPELRSAARRYAVERPNRPGFRIWVPVYSAILSKGAASPRQLDRYLVMAQAAATINPTEPPAVRTLGYVHYRRGEYAKAWEVLSRDAALPNKRYSPAVRGYRTLCLLALGRRAEARREFDAYCEHTAAHPHAVAEQLLAEIALREPNFVRP